MKLKKKFKFGLLVTGCLILKSCVIEESISAEQIGGGPEMRKQRIDSVQQIETTGETKKSLFNEPDTTKPVGYRRKG